MAPIPPIETAIAHVFAEANKGFEKLDAEIMTLPLKVGQTFELFERGIEDTFNRVLNWLGFSTAAAQPETPPVNAPERKQRSVWRRAKDWTERQFSPAPEYGTGPDSPAPFAPQSERSGWNRTKSNVANVMRYLTDTVGLTKHEAAVVTGTWQGESGTRLDPTVSPPPDRGGHTAHGIQQYRGSRWKLLQLYAAARGKSPYDPEVETEYGVREKQFAAAVMAMRRAQAQGGGIGAEVKAFEGVYEGSNDPGSIPKRTRYAEDLERTFPMSHKEPPITVQPAGPDVEQNITIHGSDDPRETARLVGDASKRGLEDVWRNSSAAVMQ
jgi:hypothetical protein